MPIWVSLRSLPLHLFPRQHLEMLLSPIGKVLAIDGPMLNFSRPSVARVCVLLNLLKENLDRVKLNMGGLKDRWQRIVYEKERKYCKVCSMQGHVESECRKKRKTKDRVKEKGMEKEKGKEQIVQENIQKEEEVSRRLMKLFWIKTMMQLGMGNS